MSEFIEITEAQHEEYNAAVDHPMQSFEWGEFRKATGVTVIRRAILSGNKLTEAFTVTIHSIPKLPFTIGYLPKSSIPSQKILDELNRIGKEYKCVFIQLEPNLTISQKQTEWKKFLETSGIKPAAHPLFTKYTFVLDITKSEDELLSAMHPKTRYNIRLATRKGVSVQEENTPEAFKEYLKLTHETTSRQGFYAHTPEYHKVQWKTLPHEAKEPYNQLSSHLLIARYEGIPLTTWILFVFKNALYYPYGASSNQHRNVMASNLMMWEAIRFGKKLGLQTFDMWGALGPDPDPNDPWYGFHRFKEGYGAVHTEFVGSYDLVINPSIYKLYALADKVRWTLLKLKNNMKLSAKPLLILLTLAAIFLAIKLPHLSIRMSDSNIYFYNGYQILHGQLLYKDIFFTNFPIIPYISAVYFLLLNGNLKLYYVTPLIETLITASFIFYIVQSKTKQLLVSTVSAAVYLFSFIILSTSDHQTGVFLASLFSVASFLAFDRKRFCLAGILSALFILTKAYFIPLALTYTVYLLIKKKYKKSSFLYYWLCNNYCGCTLTFFVVC